MLNSFPYAPGYVSSSEFLVIRGLQYHIRHWGRVGAPKVFLLHGWLDSSATYQFLVDQLLAQGDWHFIAPDWRGYGHSQWLLQTYWSADYLADLDAILDHYSPVEPCTLIAHSMGAAIASFYSGVRATRVSRLVMLDFMGMPRDHTKDIPQHINQWLDQQKVPVKANKTYANEAQFAHRLLQGNPRLTADKAHFLAHHITRPVFDHQMTRVGVEIAADPWHKVSGPNIYHIGDVLTVWRQINASVLHLVADKGYVALHLSLKPDEYALRVNAFLRCQVVGIPDAGHNIQHDQPVVVAMAIFKFLSQK